MVNKILNWLWHRIGWSCDERFNFKPIVLREAFPLLVYFPLIINCIVTYGRYSNTSCVSEPPLEPHSRIRKLFKKEMAEHWSETLHQLLDTTKKNLIRGKKLNSNTNTQAFLSLGSAHKLKYIPIVVNHHTDLKARENLCSDAKSMHRIKTDAKRAGNRCLYIGHAPSIESSFLHYNSHLPDTLRIVVFHYHHPPENEHQISVCKTWFSCIQKHMKLNARSTFQVP